jgi:hypothetical protein
MFIIFMVMKMDWNKGNRQKTQIDVFCLSKVDFKLEPQGSNNKTCLQSKILTHSKILSTSQPILLIPCYF